jgi:hypothetical protein
MRDIPVLVTYAGLKKSWHKGNCEFVDTSTHLINHKLKTIPNIANFLQKYPPTSDDSDDDESDIGEMHGGPASAQEVDGGGIDGEWGLGNSCGMQEGGELAPVDIDRGDAADDEDDDEEDEEVVIEDAGKYRHTPAVNHDLSVCC